MLTHMHKQLTSAESLASAGNKQELTDEFKTYLRRREKAKLESEKVIKYEDKEKSSN